MKHNARRSIVALLLAVALIASFAFAGAATLTEKTITVKGGVDIYMDGAKVDPKNVNGETVDAFIFEGTTYLPVRALSEMLGKDVDFDLGTGSVYVTSLAGNAEKPAEYLETMFGVKFNDTVTNGEFTSALAVITTGEDAPQTGELVPATNIEAIVAAVKAAKMDELALTYGEEKTSETIESAGVPFEVEENANYFACALDLGLINPNTDPTADLTSKVATSMAMAVAQMTGNGRNYVGRISDPDIISKANRALNAAIRADVYADDVLANLGFEIVKQEATTGYGLKSTDYNANFIPKYTIKYGHSNAAHVVQLIGLLQSEGIDAYIQISPKLSIFSSMLAWSDPNADPTERASTIRESAYPELDMDIEFDTVEDKEAFHDIIEAYAKKYAANRKEDGTFEGLIKGSSWQPLYSSSTEMQNEEFAHIYDNVVKNGKYEIHSFSLPENVEKVDAVIKAVAPDCETETNDLWVNPAFYRYITGTASE